MIRILPILLAASASLAHAPMRDDAGVALRLATGSDDTPYLGLVVIPGNSAGISASESLDATRTALEQWRTAAGGNLSYDVFKPEDQTAYPKRIKQDGLSTIFYVTAMKDPIAELGEDFHAIAYTHVWTDEDGSIVEIDMAINDRDYGFLSDPQDVDYAVTRRFILLQDVVTHELGHAIGLDHTGVMSSTQFTYNWNGQHTLGCDDRAGARALYGDGGGALTGQVEADDGTVLSGAHVLAVSLDRRTPYASALTDADGHFAIEGLEDGRYHLVVEPWLAGEGTLTGPVVSSTCSPGTLARTLITSEEGTLSTYAITGDAQDAGTLVARCTGDGAAYVEPVAEGRVLLDGNGAATLPDVLAPGQTRNLALNGISGELVVVPMAWSVFSAVRVRMDLLDSDGSVVRTLERAPLFLDETTGYRDLDGILIASDLPAGDYTLQLTAQAIPEDTVPRGDLYVDPAPYVLITAGAGEAMDTEALLSGSLTRCQDEPDLDPFPGTGATIPDPPGCSSTGAPAGVALAGLGLILGMIRRRR